MGEYKNFFQARLQNAKKSANRNKCFFKYDPEREIHGFMSKQNPQNAQRRLSGAQISNNLANAARQLNRHQNIRSADRTAQKKLLQVPQSRPGSNQLSGHTTMQSSGELCIAGSKTNLIYTRVSGSLFENKEKPKSHLRQPGHLQSLRGSAEMPTTKSWGVSRLTPSIGRQCGKHPNKQAKKTFNYSPAPQRRKQFLEVGAASLPLQEEFKVISHKMPISPARRAIDASKCFPKAPLSANATPRNMVTSAT